MSDIPITIKMRTGIYENKNTAHKVVPLVKEWGVGAISVRKLLLVVCCCVSQLFFFFFFLFLMLF